MSDFHHSAKFRPCFLDAKEASCRHAPHSGFRHCALPADEAGAARLGLPLDQGTAA